MLLIHCCCAVFSTIRKLLQTTGVKACHCPASCWSPCRESRGTHCTSKMWAILSVFLFSPPHERMDILVLLCITYYIKIWQFMLCVFRSWSALQKATVTRFLWKKLWRGQKSFASRFGLHLLSLLPKFFWKFVLHVLCCIIAWTR